jgi:hypothetical protein
MSLRNKLIVGLADEEAGSRVAAVASAVESLASAVTGSPADVTVAGTVTRVAASGGTLAFFGVTGSARATSAAVTDFATLKTALQNYGLIGT